MNIYVPEFRTRLIHRSLERAFRVIYLARVPAAHDMIAGALC